MPLLKTWEELGFSGIAEGSGPVESGAVLFAQMPADKQLKILGPAKYMAYREGRLSLGNLVGRKVSTKWGVTHYERSLKELGLDQGELLKEFRDYRVQQLAAASTLPTLTDIEKLTATDVLVIGELNKSIVNLWTEKIQNNLQVVLTGKQRIHYINNHPEMRRYEELLVDAVLNPDEVHRNVKDGMMAIFYKKVDQHHYLRVAVLLQGSPNERMHSILSYRLANVKEIVESINSGRFAWG